MRRRLVVMVKAPRPGRVKTRLGRQIGMVPAAWWMRHQTTRLLRRLRDPRWDIWLAVAPDTRSRDPAWPADLPRVPQGPGDLGDRMGRLLRNLPPDPVCIIGSDIPGITRRHIARAFAALGPAEAGFGPAPDGGFWLVGMKRLGPPPATLFRDVRWSSEHALSDTLATLPGLRIAMVDELNDVDEASDL